MKKIAIFIIMFFLISSGIAQAEGIDLTGKSSLGIMGSYQNWSSGDDHDIDVLSGGLGLSYFLTKNWEIGVSSMANYSWDDSDDDDYPRWSRDDDDDDDDERGAISLESICNYNFSTGQNWMPYIGAAAGGVYYGSGDDDDFGGSLGAQAGVKFFASDSVFFNVEYRYRHWFVDAGNDDHGSSRGFFRRGSDDDDDDDDLNSHGVFVGVNWVF